MVVSVPTFGVLTIFAGARVAKRFGLWLVLTRTRLSDRLRLRDRREDTGDYIAFASEQPVRTARVKTSEWRFVQRSRFDHAMETMPSSF
jgi:hypothetical protein